MAGSRIQTSKGMKLVNPGSQPMFRKTLTCNRPFTQLQELCFLDWLLEAPATASSFDLSANRVKKLRGTPGDSFRLSSLLEQPF